MTNIQPTARMSHPMMIEPNTELTPVMRQQVTAMIDRRIAETPVTREDVSELKAVVAELERKINIFTYEGKE